MRARDGMGLGLVLLVLAVPSMAMADAAQDPAEALTRHGVELRRQRRDREALEEFRHAYELAKAPRTLAQIALAEQALGRWVDAEKDLQQALTAAGDPWIARNRDALQSGLATIASRLASLEVTADVAGAELLVNGVRTADLPLPVPLRVEAGTLVIDVRARGYAPVRRETSAEPGGSVRETVQLVPLVLPQTAAAPDALRPRPLPTLPYQPARSDRAMRSTGLVLLGAGAFGVAAGAYFGVRTLSTKSSRDSSGGCMGQVCNATGVGLDAEARSLALRSTVWFTAGLAAAAGGAFLRWVSRSRTHAVTRGLRLSPEAGPDHAGLWLGGTW